MWQVSHTMSVMIPDTHWDTWFGEEMLVPIPAHEPLLLKVISRARWEACFIEVEAWFEIPSFFLLLLLSFGFGPSFALEIGVFIRCFVFLVVLVSSSFDIWIKLVLDWSEGCLYLEEHFACSFIIWVEIRVILLCFVEVCLLNIFKVHVAGDT